MYLFIFALAFKTLHTILVILNMHTKQIKIVLFLICYVYICMPL